MAHLVLLFCLAAIAGNGAAERLVNTPQGDEIPIETYAAEGRRLLLWLPHELGATPRRVALAQRLADRGIEVWTPDLHAAWFLPAGSHSLSQVDPVVAAALIDAAVGTGKQVFLVAEGRSVALALSGVRAWQQATDDTSALAGLLAFNPNLLAHTPQGAEAAEYLPIAAASNLPVYVLQPEESAGFWRIGDGVRELEKGGASVFVHRLAGVGAGFYARPDVTGAEEALTRRLPGIIAQAMLQLEGFGGTPPDPAPLHGAVQPTPRPERTSLLHPAAQVRDAPELRLPSLRDGEIDLAGLRGKVVLVNFWATWCPPCVEEIPSLQRLYRELRPAGLEILAVDVGENTATMEAFLEDKPVEFPVLMDRDGDALRRWGVYAFPTTLVLDREHRIRYAVFGAFDWSSGEVVGKLRTLLSDRTRPADQGPR